MSAFWRSLFTSHHETRPTTPSPLAASAPAPAQQPPRKKQHGRSSSSPTNLSAGAGATRHIYTSSNSTKPVTKPGHSASSAHAAHPRSHSRPDRKRSSSCVATSSSSSPVRFAASARVTEERSYAASSRPPYMRSNSHGSGGPNSTSSSFHRSLLFFNVTLCRPALRDIRTVDVVHQLIPNSLCYLRGTNASSDRQLQQRSTTQLRDATSIKAAPHLAR